MNKAELLKLLETTKAETIEYFGLDQNILGKSYSEGKWTIRQILHHLADAETVLYDRIRRAISNPGQVVWGFEQDEWAQKLDYNVFPLAINKNIYSSVRESIIYLADKYYESLGDNKVVHSETGMRTLKDLFEKVALHNQGHLEQIKIAKSR